MIGNQLYKLRTGAKLSQEEFARLFGVSRQSVQKWETGASVPEIEKLVKIARHFGVSLDRLILDKKEPSVRERELRSLQPRYDIFCFYNDLDVEYVQSLEEGLDVEPYKALFDTFMSLPRGAIRERLGDVLFDIVMNAGPREGYPYEEPSALEDIQALRKPFSFRKKAGGPSYEERVAGAWMGRICGCLLGKTWEGILSFDIEKILKMAGAYPLTRYLRESEITPEIEAHAISINIHDIKDRCFVDHYDGMPPDDDTNYTVMGQTIIDRYGPDFTPNDVANAWLFYQVRDRYCTAENVAYRNFSNGFPPPSSAIYKNPFREWIGAQIRGDYFGYIHPGCPEKAAAMAWRDASISHIKNGIYGEMFVAAMLAVAAETDRFEDIVEGGLAQVPYTSRLYESVSRVLKLYRDGASLDETRKVIHETYDECTPHGWCHTVGNAMIVTASLLYGGGDYSRSICLAVETGYDTDCNGATVGSIVGMAKGRRAIPDVWTAPVGDVLYTHLFEKEKVSIAECVEKTIAHRQS